MAPFFSYTLSKFRFGGIIKAWLSTMLLSFCFHWLFSGSRNNIIISNPSDKNQLSLLVLAFSVLVGRKDFGFETKSRVPSHLFTCLSHAVEVSILYHLRCEFLCSFRKCPRSIPQNEKVTRKLEKIHTILVGKRVQQNTPVNEKGRSFQDIFVPYYWILLTVLEANCWKKTLWEWNLETNDCMSY